MTFTSSRLNSEKTDGAVGDEEAIQQERTRSTCTYYRDFESL